MTIGNEIRTVAKDGFGVKGALKSVKTAENRIKEVIAEIETLLA